MDIEFLQIGNFKIEYFVEGEGPDILLLHGGGSGSYRAYLHFVEELSKHYCVWAPSLPGGGKSSGIPSDWKFSDYSKIVKSFVTKLNIRPHLVGHSLGGAVAIRTKALYPKLFRRVVLLAPAGLDKSLSEDLNTVSSVLQNELPVLFFLKKGIARSDILIDVLTHKVDLVRIVQMLLKLDLTKSLQKLPGEVIIIWGKKDNVLPVEYAKEFKKLLRKKKIYILDGGHYVFDEHPRKVTNIIHREIN